MSRVAAKDSFAPAGAHASVPVTSGFARGYVLSPLRGFDGCASREILLALKGLTDSEREPVFGLAGTRRHIDTDIPADQHERCLDTKAPARGITKLQGI